MGQQFIQYLDHSFSCNPCLHCHQQTAVLLAMFINYLHGPALHAMQYLDEGGVGAILFQPVFVEDVSAALLELFTAV